MTKKILVIDNMRKKRVLYFTLFLSLISLTFFIRQAYAKAKYDEMFSWVSNPIFKTRRMSKEENKFVDEVLDSWDIGAKLDPDIELCNFLNNAGYEKSVEGFLKISGHTFPNFSFFNSGRNQQVSEIVGTLDLLSEQTVDNTILYRKGLAYMELKSSHKAEWVQIYEDGEKGVRSTIFIRKNFAY